MSWPYARVSLHVPSLLQMWDLSLLSYLFLLFSFLVFPFFFWGGGGLLIFFKLITSMVLHQWPKNKIKTLKTPTCEIFVFDVLLWGLHPHTFSHLAHIITVTLKPSTPENRTSLLHHVLSPVLKCSFLQCFSNINQTCPQNRPLTKMITLHNAQNKTGCFRNGLLWKMKTFMLTKTHNWKNEKTKLRKEFWKTKQNRKPPKTKIIDEKKPLNVKFCREINTKKQGKKKQQKTRKEKINKKARKKKKTRNKRERERQRVKKEKWQNQGERKGDTEKWTK